MNEIIFSLEYARRKKLDRLKRNKMKRRKVRSICFSNSFSSDLLDVEQSINNNISSLSLMLCDESSSEAKNSPRASPTNDNKRNKSENVNSPSSSYEYLEFDDICGNEEIPYLSLHPYTTLGCYSFARDLIRFIREANISKTHVEHLISLIQYGLPQPNTLPKTYAGILDLLSVKNLFMKRIVCISCKKDLTMTSKTCSDCPNDSPRRLAYIFDAIQELVFTRVYDHFRFIIDEYRESFTKEKFNETNDIVYNTNYKIIYDSVSYPFITIIIHLDGISLDKSNVHHLWILSCSLVELPPAVRSRRQNNIVLSLWISNEQPDVQLWLNHCFMQLVNLKIKGNSTFK